MIFFKVFAQVLLGLSSIGALLIDYKWHDKRTKLFKRLRTGLLVVTIVSLVTSIILMIFDERDKKQEVSLLNTQLGNATAKLDSAGRQLYSIRASSARLENKLQPFLDLAAYRYPDLDSNSALKRLKTELQLLTEKTQYLSGAEQSRQQSESDLERLKQTPPELDVTAIMNGAAIQVGVIFKNKVPVLVGYSLIHRVGSVEQTTISGGGQAEVYPPANGSPIYFQSGMGILQADQKNRTDQVIQITLHYQSIYFKETLNPQLQRQLVKTFRVDQINNRFIPM